MVPDAVTVVSDQFFDATPDAIVVVDESGTIAMVNQRCQTLLGYVTDELVGQPIEILVPEASRAAHLDYQRRYRSDPRVRTMGDPTARLTAQTASGALIAVDIALSPVTVGDDQMVMAVLRDVRERVAAEAEIESIRREAEERLRSSEAAFRSAFDDAAVPMAILDLQDPQSQAIVRANEALAHLLGLPVDELAGRSIVELTHPDDRDASVARASALAAGRPSAPAALRFRRTDGTYRWAAVNTSRLSIDDSQLLVHIIDINRQVEAEHERDRREELLRALAGVRGASLDERPVDEVLQLIVVALNAALDVPLAVIATPNAGGQLEIQTTADDPRWDLSGAVLPATSVAGRVMKTAEIEVVPAPAGLSPLLSLDDGIDRRVGSIVVVPLQTANTMEGVVAIARHPDKPPFSERDLTVAQSLASEAAVSVMLDRARADKRRMLLAEDRERIARDLHDVVIQRLYATGMRLQAATAHPDLLAERSEEVVADLDDTIDNVRAAIFQLNQPDDTVAGELRRLIDRHQAAGRIRVTLEVDGDLELLPPMVVNHLLPTVNELVSNAERHAAADEAVVRITAADGELMVRVSDDGIGLDPGVSQGFGLRNLTRRAMSLGGSLDYGNRAEVGSEFTWTVPLEPIDPSS